eukprot:Nk52_evm28s1129 gene=Nk52_evmTU28s1129
MNVRRGVIIAVPFVLLAIVAGIVLYIIFHFLQPSNGCESAYGKEYLEGLVAKRKQLGKSKSYEFTANNFVPQKTGIYFHNGERQYYDPDQVKFTEERMTITPAVGDHANSKYPPAKSGKVISKFTINCGDIVEIEATLPTKDGAWAALWTLPQISIDADEKFYERGGQNWVWPTGGELDIVEVSSSQKSYSSAIHYRLEPLAPYNCRNLNQGRDCYVTARIDLEYEAPLRNTYYLYRECDRVTMWIEDQEPHLSQCHPYMVPEEKYNHHLIMNLALGGSLGSDISINEKSLEDMEMTIHSVTVYYAGTSHEYKESEKIPDPEPINHSPVSTFLAFCFVVFALFSAAL